jgi:hypothetical protein
LKQKPKRKWDFRVTADELPDGMFRVELKTKSGQSCTRVGINPLHELIRIIGGKKPGDAKSKSISELRDGFADATRRVDGIFRSVKFLVDRFESDIDTCIKDGRNDLERYYARMRELDAAAEGGE